jgi:hypothetical protein
MSNTDKGLLAGGGLGAATGALVGAATGHAGAGAAIGGVVGAAAGGLTGAAVDSSQHKAEVKAAAAAQARAALGLSDVAKLAQSGVSDAVIIEQIRASGAVYQLTADQILWLRQNNVSETVIREMQQTALRGPGVVYAPGQPVYVVDPYGPPAVGVGFTYVGGRRYYYR